MIYNVTLTNIFLVKTDKVILNLYVNVEVKDKSREP